MLKHLPLDASWIASRIPHQGRMCLLDSVVSWDAQRIRCSATSHRAADHPMRAYGRLGAACGIEYAAQAMAAHAALQSGADDAPPRAGYLISVRGVHLHVARLDDIAAELFVEAECVIGSASHVLYQFRILAQENVLLEGRASAVLNADTLSPIATAGDAG